MPDDNGTSLSTNTIPMDHLQANMRSRDMHVEQSERWCDPRAKLFSGAT